MEATGEPARQLNSIVIQLAMLFCHAPSMTLTIAIIIGLTRAGFHGRGIGHIEFVSAFTPATLSGYVYRRLTQGSPSSGLTWWMAILFTLSTFGIVGAAARAFGQITPLAGLDRMQSNGVILGTGLLSILVSAVLFRLGASTRKEDRDTIKRVLTRTRGRDAP